MYKVAVIGDRESVCGFKAMGIDIFTPDTKEESSQLLKQLCSAESHAIIYITEELGEFCKEVINKYESKICPAIVLIPGVNNNTGEGMKQLNRSVEKAVGSQLLE